MHTKCMRTLISEEDPNLPQKLKQLPNLGLSLRFHE